MLELLKRNIIDTQLVVETVDLLHFDPSNPDACCTCGQDRHHCPRKQHCNCSHRLDEAVDFLSK